jgi:hypothetical protein
MSVRLAQEGYIILNNIHANMQGEWGSGGAGEWGSGRQGDEMHIEKTFLVSRSPTPPLSYSPLSRSPAPPLS